MNLVMNFVHVTSPIEFVAKRKATCDSYGPVISAITASGGFPDSDYEELRAVVKHGSNPTSRSVHSIVGNH